MISSDKAPHSSTNENSNRTPIQQPQPIHRRTSSSYSEKFELYKQNHRGDNLVFTDTPPPDPIKTPSLDDATPMKPYLRRSSTTNYQSELENNSQWGWKKPPLHNAVTFNDAYHDQQRRKSELNGIDANWSPSPAVEEKNNKYDIPQLDKSNLENNQIESNNGNGDDIQDSNRRGKTDYSSPSPSLHDDDDDNDIKDNNPNTPNTEEDTVVNDLDHFKRRFSWWSKD